MALKAGIVGYGLAGKVFHAPLLPAAGIELAGVASSDPAKVHADHPDATVHATADALFADDSLDLVILASPSATHAPLAIKALQAGRHVVVDKPFATTVAEADQVIEAARSANRLVTCFQNRRWDGDFLTLRHLIEQDRLGPIHAYEAHFEFFKPAPADRWQETPGPGVGVHFDLGAHLIDQALVLFGRPDWVEGEAIIQRPGGQVPDAFFARLAFGPVRATLTGSYFSADNRSRCVAHGARGSWRKWHMDVQEEQLRAGLTPLDPGFGIEPVDRHGSLTSLSDNGLQRVTIDTRPGTHHEFYRQMRRAIENGGPPPVDPNDARNTIEVIEALVASGKTGKRVGLSG